MKKILLILTAFASLTMANFAQAQTLKPEKTQLFWDSWNIQIKDLYFTDSVKKILGGLTVADSDSEFVYLKFTIKNSSHEGKTFIPSGVFKIVIGDNAYDAADLGDLDYLNNIEPTLTRTRECYFELPKAEIKDSFSLKLSTLFKETNFDLVTIVSAPAPTPTPVAVIATPIATPTPISVEQTVAYKPEPPAWAVPAPETILQAAENDLNNAWNSLTPAQRHSHMRIEKNWIKFKDGIAEVENRIIIVKARALYLWTLVNDPNKL
jgi:hypothetical protein